MTRARWTIGAGICVIVAAGMAGGADMFPLVDGEKQATIVGASVIPRLQKLGYYMGPPKFLKHYIAESTGRTLDTVPEKAYDPATMPYPIYVGKSQKGMELFGDKLATMDADGYIVHVASDMVVLIGASDVSTAWAQFDFAREYLGIDVYFPGKCGLVVPTHKDVRVPVGTRIEEPVFLSRAFSALNTYRQMRGKPDIPWRMYRRYAFSHNIHSFIKVEEYGESHPEYFAWRNGKRMIVSTSAGPGPCISNPDVVKIIIDKCRAYFDANPERLTVSLGMTDGGWCECEQCQAMDGPSLEIGGDTSPKSVRYYTLLNQVARALQESHPGKSVGVLGYGGAEYPPADIKVERNIIPYMCYSRANWYNPEAKAVDMASTDAWAERVDKIGVYEYLYGSPYSVPRLYLHNLAEFLRHVAENGGGGFYAEIYSNHGLDGPKAWVVEKLLWDPYQDVDALVAAWCKGVFEEAAEPMQRYFQGLEETWNRNGMRAGPSMGKLSLHGDDAQLEIFRPEDLVPRRKELEEARRLAKSPAVQERIEYFSSTFKITELTCGKFHAYKKAKQLWEDDADGAALLAALIEGDRSAPEEDVKAYTERLQAQDSSKFLGGVEVKAATEIARKVVTDVAWPEVYRALKGGARDPAALVKVSRAAMLAAAGSSEGDAIAEKRVDGLLKMSSRIALAHRVETSPTIDGNPVEDWWTWTRQHPWFAWKSGTQVDHETHFALAYDDDYLYVAVRCPQDDLATMKRCEGYGSPAWKYASVEVFINPDERDAALVENVKRDIREEGKLALYQVIAGFGGCLWERGQNATEEYACTDDESEWRVELKISFKKLGFSPAEFPYMRLGLVRNVAGGGHSGVAWFPSTGAHASYDARGWVIFE